MVMYVCILTSMVDATRKPYTFYIDAELIEGLERVKERDGVSVSEQIRRAIADWLKTKGERSTPRKRQTR
jgi:hypothetical protein